MALRSVVKLKDVTADATTGYTIALPAPVWARRAILHVAVTAVAGTTPVFDCKVQQKNPDGSGTAIDTTVAIDQITAAANRFAIWGNAQAAVAGTNIDAFAIPVSKYQQILIVTDRTTGDETYTYKVWVEYMD